MKVKCPYCDSSLIFKDRNLKVGKGWVVLKNVFLKKCNYCKKNFDVFVVGNKLVAKRRVKKRKKLKII